MDTWFLFPSLVIFSAIFGFALPFFIPIQSILMVSIMVAVVLSFILVVFDSGRRSIGNFILGVLVFSFFMFMAAMVGGVIHSFIFNEPINPSNTGGRYRYYVI